ncbi:molybdenum cofactor biosynthesis F family protein [Actinoplanes sp. NPDC051513]|uniref:molybdenum cofactor biosynthesis F family protein n=1 Tax=Actinoplanes sp. NPDC051513 TaxID=3363908 RepID=UPI003799DD55
MNETISPADLAPWSGEARPDGWKGMDDFARGIDGNRIAGTAALTGSSLSVDLDDGDRLDLGFVSADRVRWAGGDRSGDDWYEAVEVRPGVFFVTLTFAGEPLRASVLVVDVNRGRSLAVESHIAGEPTPGRPRVSQTFRPGTVAGTPALGAPAAPTRDLIGWRALYRYSPNHLYEHIYLSSERYAWQCLVGEQRGHGDVDLASTWSLGDGLYVFTFREFLIPVAATWLYDLTAMRTTGVFFGLGATGAAQCAPGGAIITELGRVSYPDEQPI